MPLSCLASSRSVAYVLTRVCIRTPVWARGEGRRHTTSRRDWLRLQWEGGMLSCYHGNTSSGCHGDETRHRLLDRSYYYNSSRCIAWRHLPPRLAATNSRHRLAYIIALCVTRCTLILRVRNTLVGQDTGGI